MLIFDTLCAMVNGNSIRLKNGLMYIYIGLLSRSKNKINVTWLRGTEGFDQSFYCVFIGGTRWSA